ncbi:14801_t:CDS:2, partial [Gigaspora rosea]
SSGSGNSGGSSKGGNCRNPTDSNNSSDSDSTKRVQLVKICCLIHDDPEYSCFKVEISKSKNAGDLKRAIKKDSRPLLDKFATKDLKLWSINIDLTTENPQQAALGDLNANITSVLGGQLLDDSLKLIEEEFPTLPNKHAHVIVELPTSSNVANKWRK